MPATAPATKPEGPTYMALGPIDRDGKVVPPGSPITFGPDEAEHVADLKAAGLLGDPKDAYWMQGMRPSTLPDIAKRALDAQGPRESERLNVARLTRSPNDLLPAGSVAGAGEE